MMKWISEQARQPSTLNGVTVLLGLLGVSNAEGWVQHLAMIALGVSGLIDIIRRGRSWGEVLGRSR